MKKNYLTGAVLPVLAATAIVGSGFSIWFFNDANTEESHNLSVNVTQKVGIGAFTVADNFTLTFDQTAEGRKLATGVTESKLEAKGIYAAYTDGDSARKIVTYQVGENVSQTGLQTTITTTIVVPTKLANFFDITYVGDEFTPRVKKSVDANDGTKTNYVQTIVYENTATNDWQFDWSKVKFTYAAVASGEKDPMGVAAELGDDYKGYKRTGDASKETWEPVNQYEYNKLVEAVQDIQINVTYTAVVEAHNK